MSDNTIKDNSITNISETRIFPDSYFLDNGYLDLKKLGIDKFNDSDNIKGSSYALNWFPAIINGITYNFLLKHLPNYDVDYSIPFYQSFTNENKKYEKVKKYNSLFISEIIKQLGFNSAEYYFAINENKEYLLTSSFLRDGEKIISIDDILNYFNCQSDDSLKINNINTLVRKYCTEKLKISNPEEINKICDNIFSSLYISKFLNVGDYHYGDSGFIYNEQNNNLRSLPMFDLDLSLDFMNQINHSLIL